MASRNTTAYYDRTAKGYDRLHGDDHDPEHRRALELAWPMMRGVGSVLDVGSGTGRALEWVSRQGWYSLHGIEPSGQLNAIAQAKLPHADIQNGTGEDLPFADASIDLVMATGIMHHADDPQRVMREMFRVARRYVLISDHNNYAFGGSRARRVRMCLDALGLLKAATFVRHGFRRQGYSEEDGYWYPYSLLNDYALVASLSRRVCILPTRPSSLSRGNLLMAQSHLAYLAEK